MRLMSRQPVADASTLRRSLGIDEALLSDIRVAGECFGDRVPEMVDRFYQWLAPLPEFAHFFADDRVLLRRVKSHQTAYWRDFLRAEVDEDYVERRRAVGQVHARIELGLLIYLRAMEFVEGWLLHEVEAHAALCRERPSISFSIRKLVHFDSAIVVNTYASRTAHLLEEQRERLARVAEVMRAVTHGDLDQRVEVTSPTDLLGRSVNEMVESLRGICGEMRSIARGDYSGDIAPRSDRDELGVSLQAMTRALRDASAANERHLQMTTSLAELGDAMSGNPTVGELSRAVVGHLCRTLGALVGAFYVVEASTDVVRRTGTYAVSDDDEVPGEFRFGEGLVGQVAAQQRRIIVTEVPQDCLRIRWGLGEAVPRSLAVVPLVHGGRIRGVLELGSLQTFSEHQLEVLDRSASSVGLAISAAETRAKLRHLLDESRAQAEELTQQQEELRAVNEQLERQARTLELQKGNLEATETVLRQKAAELELSSHYKSEFLANMSHELRTPLNSSLILARLLAENQEGNLSADQVKYAQSIHSAGNELLELINDILDLSKIEAGKIDLRIEPIAVPRLLDVIRDRFEPLVADKEIAFSVACEPGCPDTIETDFHRLQQILSNLVANAAKFTSRGSIRLRAVDHRPDHVAFHVEDTGIGISADKHDVIFDAFRQADGTTSRKFGGTGLGLSICRELAGLLGGSIELRSTPGVGSTFTVLVPRSPPISGVAPPRSHRATPARPLPPLPVRDTLPKTTPAADVDHRNATSERPVLVIDGDSCFSDAVHERLAERGLRCLQAGSGREGLRLAAHHRPAAVVLDVELPDGSGLAILELLKRDPETRHVPVIVASARPQSQVVRKLGAAEHILKPLERLDGLVEPLERCLFDKTKRVLLVEDNDVQREAVRRLLTTAADVHVEAVATAGEALLCLERSRFDCMVLDLMLPDGPAFDVLGRLGGTGQHVSMPVIVYTARMLDADEEQRLRRHSRSVIIKGARSPERLLDEVTLFLHQDATDLAPDAQRMLEDARSQESVFRGRRILLVEDDVRNVFALTSLLEREGIAVEVARNGKEALSRLSDGPSVDLVLMDVMMPEMDGLTATRRIRSEPRHGRRSLPIIALTAKAMPDDRQQCLGAGATDYITKPIDPVHLLSMMRVWLTLGDFAR